MSSPATTPIKASTQEHLNIEDIADDIAILKDGSCAIIIQVTAINFNLLSEGEQDAIVYAYAGLLNSLTFPIQLIVRSNIKDVTDYLRLVKRQEQKQKKPLLLNQLRKYRQFIESTIRDNQVLDKKFYVVIPFNSLELGLSPNTLNPFQKQKKLIHPKAYVLERAKMSLYPKRDHLFRQLGRLGLRARQLNTQQLIELFYNYYNQSPGQRFAPKRDYETPIIEQHPLKRSTKNVAGETQPPPNTQNTPASSPTNESKETPIPVPSTSQEKLKIVSSLYKKPSTPEGNNVPDSQNPTKMEVEDSSGFSYDNPDK
ncbi:MAG: hypothetical protein ACOX6V_05190 [Patescibacteria group bacterium]|jgi:hypothetical protein